MKIVHKIICVIILIIIVYLLYTFLNKQEKFEDINLEPLHNSFIIEDKNIVNNTIKIKNNVYDISGINNENSIIEKERRYSNYFICNIDFKYDMFYLLIDNYFSHLLINGTDEDKTMVYQLINMINENGFIEPDLIPDNSIIYNSKLDSNFGWLDIYDEVKKPYIEIELTNERIINGIIIQSIMSLENFILITNFTVETSNNGIIWEALKDKNNKTEPKLFHIDYEINETVKKINTETNELGTNEIGTNGNQDITTYEIIDYDKKYGILIENFTKCKYIRVYPIKYYISTDTYSNDINVISNDNYKTYFVDNETPLCDNKNPMFVGMRLGLLTTEYILTTQPSTTQPSTTQPSTTQPSTTQPSTTQPSTTQPSTIQPSITQPQPLGSNDFNIGMVLKGSNNEGNLNDFLSKNTMLGNDIYISPNGISGSGFDMNDDFFEESSNNKIIDSSFYPMIDLQ